MGSDVSLTGMLVPTYRQMLRAMAGWLDKAERQLPDGGAEALLAASLADDMFPLATQVRFACVQAREGVARLREESFAPEIDLLLDEGRKARERPGSLAEAQTRIAETVDYLDSLTGPDPDVAPDRAIAHTLPTGLIFDLTAEQYVRDWALPQFYFHVMIAYAILRRSGVELGKADYVSHLFAFVRPGTMPT